MKYHSRNIRPTAGILALKNLNVFPASTRDAVRYEDGLEAAFRQAVGRAAALARRAVPAGWGARPDMFTLMQLSTPVLRALGNNTYQLDGGLLLWLGHLFRPGARFSVRGNHFAIETPELVELATDTPAKMTEMRYDTYNASRLGEISDEVLAELDIQLDKSRLAYAYADEEEGVKTWDELADVENGMNEVKYLSVYAPALAPDAVGRVIAYPVLGDEPAPDPELGFDASAFTDLVANKTAYFDRFLVEFTDPSQPFAYITIELLGQELVEDDGEGSALPSKDGFADLFDAAHRDRLAQQGWENVVAGLDAIAAGA